MSEKSTSFTIRPAQVDDAAALARVHVDTWRTTYAGIVPDEHLANLRYERSQALWEEHLSNPRGEITYVAESPAGQVVGFATGGPARDDPTICDGEVYGLYVRKAFQGQGIGRQLVEQLASDLAGAGYHSLVIWVLKENPACRFYERLGGRAVAEKVVTIGGKPLVDAGYGWPDLAINK